MAAPDFLGKLRLHLEDVATNKPVAPGATPADEDLWGRASDFKRYAEEIRAVRREDGRLVLTSIGRVLLDLVGRDALRWLLEVEIAQAIGPGDPWRITREAAAALGNLEMDPKYGWVFIDLKNPWWQFAWEPMFRLCQAGLLECADVGEDDNVVRQRMIRIPDTGKTLLNEIANLNETPFKVLAATLLQDETAKALSHRGSSIDAALSESAAELGARQARMVAHEVRNALVPVQVALEGLYRDTKPIDDRAVETYRRRIDSGIDRIFRFVEDTLNAMTLVAEPREPFDLDAAIRDAIASFEDQKEEVSFSTLVSVSVPPAVGRRDRFVLALINLYRNAIQATASRLVKIKTAVQMDQSREALIVSVEDDGPGVPENFRQAIFTSGFSLRQGGSGQGLALVRDVIERDMLGKITCEASPLGGARFVLRLPVVEKGRG